MTRYIDNDRAITAHVAAEEAAVTCIVADRYARPEDPHADAAHEHAVEGFALAARELVDAINAGDPQDWPIGWACGEVGTGWPNGTDGGPVNTEPCRLRPEHEGKHDWALAEDAAPVGFIVLLHENGRWTDNWDGTVHPDRVAGDEALGKAREAGYEAMLTAAVPAEAVAPR